MFQTDTSSSPRTVGLLLVESDRPTTGTGRELGTGCRLAEHPQRGPTPRPVHSASEILSQIHFKCASQNLSCLSGSPTSAL